MQKSILITGASRGIGRACALRFAGAGFRVGINYLQSEQAARTLQDKIRMCGGCAELYCADVSDEAAVGEMFSAFGHADVLINNAGVAWNGLLSDMSLSQWEKVFAVNMRGTFLCAKAVLPQMISRKCGVILNVSSMWGRCGASCEVAYSASKAAVIGFTKALAKELGPSGIRVNCVAPGVIDTDMNADLSPRDMRELADETPLSRIGTCAEVADLLFYLASAQSSFVTGQVIGVDGGFVL